MNAAAELWSKAKQHPYLLGAGVFVVGLAAILLFRGTGSPAPAASGTASQTDASLASSAAVSQASRLQYAAQLAGIQAQSASDANRVNAALSLGSIAAGVTSLAIGTAGSVASQSIAAAESIDLAQILSRGSVDLASISAQEAIALGQQGIASQSIAAQQSVALENIFAGQTIDLARLAEEQRVSDNAAAVSQSQISSAQTIDLARLLEEQHTSDAQNATALTLGSIAAASQTEANANMFAFLNSQLADNYNLETAIINRPTAAPAPAPDPIINTITQTNTVFVPFEMHPAAGTSLGGGLYADGIGGAYAPSQPSGG